ncbi:MAG TPA: M50 family metallopeptidase [Candidatus Woesebacteria bacterium]|nr:M50 family metallopeptidase [Candidatus Woesebacteria bacterium]HRT40316.1 M50 family metallopeptidase [Candidatus Woesebacteria bacterium]
MDLLIFLIALSVLVLVHELGHYFFAVRSGVKVEEFGLGLPPRIISRKIGQTVFSLNWLPIGGFCKLYGEEEEGKGKKAFNNKTPWQKFWVVIGGVLMNLLLAGIIFSGVYLIIGGPKETNRVKILAVVPNSPAAVAGLQEGDWIKAINNEIIEKPAELIDLTEKIKGKKAELIIEREGMEKKVDVEVRVQPPEGEGAMGVAISNIEMQKIRWYEFYRGIGYGFEEAYYWGKIIVGGVVRVVSDLFHGETPKDMAGPIGMYEATSIIKRNQGILAVIHFFGVVSVNLAVVNILPFPALDGGRIIFVLYEMITKRKPNKELEIAINSIGMWLLLLLIFVVTVGDIKRLVLKQ